MLETKIETLSNTIERLIVALDRMVVAPDLSPEPKAKEPKVKPAVSVQLPGRDRLQAKCLELVKADRANKARITDLIAQHSDGGKLIKDIPDHDLTAFAEALDVL